MWWAWVLLGIIIVAFLVVMYALCRISSIWSRMEERRDLEERLNKVSKG